MDDTENITRKTWCRIIEPVNKIGYMDGAADAQATVFQSSFNMGYKQGMSFGIELGSRNALLSVQHPENSLYNENELTDPRKINCQLCINGIPAEQNVVNLYNSQQESNIELIKQKQYSEND